MDRRTFLVSSMSGLLLPVARPAPSPVSTLVGTGEQGSASDGDVAPNAKLNNPFGVLIGPDGAMWLCEYGNHRVLRLDMRSKKVSVIAGNGEKAYMGDEGPAIQASMSTPHEVRFDKSGNIYIAERDNHVIRRIDARTRRISTLAGTGQPGFGGDGGPANKAQLRQPHSVAFDRNGNLLICDIANHRVRQVDMKTGIISTFAGTGEQKATPDDGVLEGAALNNPRSIDTDPEGNIYLVLRQGNAIYKIDLRSRRIKRIAGTGETGYSGDGGPALSAKFNGPKGIAYSSDQSIYVSDTESHVIRRVNLKTGVITTVLGTGERGDGPDGDPLRCKLARPHGVFLYRGVLYVGDSENHRIRVLSPV